MFFSRHLLLWYLRGMLFGCLEGEVSSLFFLIEAGYGCLTSFLLSCVCVVVIYSVCLRCVVVITYQCSGGGDTNVLGCDDVSLGEQ
jgi:hypothetical protein